jgi:HEPN domain-containing protein
LSAKLAQAFLHAAGEDLAAAKRLLPDLPRPAGCHLQQAVEKLAKAMLAEAGVAPVPRSHDIGYLAALLPLPHPLAAALAALADLTEFGVTAWYPLGEELAPVPASEELRLRASAVDALLRRARSGLDP